jgi:hypothetical protein
MSLKRTKSDATLAEIESWRKLPVIAVVEPALEQSLSSRADHTSCAAYMPTTPAVRMDPCLTTMEATMVMAVTMRSIVDARRQDEYTTTS